MIFNGALKQLEQLARQSPKQIAGALYETLEEDTLEVKRRTPVDKGNLRATVHVTPPEVRSSEIEAAIVAGGPAAPYARSQHENLGYRHTVGQAKFIESVLRENLSSYPVRIAKKMDV